MFEDIEELALAASTQVGRTVSVAEVERALPTGAHDPFDIYDLDAVIRGLAAKRARVNVEAQVRAHAVELAADFPRVLTVDAPLRRLCPKATPSEREEIEHVTLRCLLLTCGDWPSVGNVLAGRFKKVYKRPNSWDKFEDQVDAQWAKQAGIADAERYHRAAHALVSKCMNRSNKDEDRMRRRAYAEWRVFLCLWLGTAIENGDLSAPALPADRSYAIRSAVFAVAHRTQPPRQFETLIRAAHLACPSPEDPDSFRRMAYRAIPLSEREWLRNCDFEPDDFMLFGRRFQCADALTTLNLLAPLLAGGGERARAMLDDLIRQGEIWPAP